jgi:hypothetical protein
MSESLEIDKKVGFWIRRVPYLWSRRWGNSDWKGWERRYIFLENEIGNFLPEECEGAVRQYFNYISRDQFEYELNSPDWRLSESTVRIEGKDINPYNVPVVVLFNYRGKKLLDHIEREISLPYLEIPVSEEEPTVLSDYSKDWNLWFSVWYIDNVMGKDKRVCFPVNPNSSVIGLEIFDYPEGVILEPPLKYIIRLCQKNTEFRFIYLPVYHVKPKSSHTLLLIMDLYLNRVYYLDPVGVKSRLSQDILDKIMKHLGLNPDIWEIGELDYCPIGFQELQHLEKEVRLGDPGGFCMVWILWIVETLIKNPDQHFQSIIHQAHKQMKEETPLYTRFIRRYTKGIIDYQRNSPKKKREYIKHSLKEYVKYLERD